MNPSSRSPFLSLLVGAALLAVMSTPISASNFGLYASIKAGTTDVDASLGDNFDQVISGDDETSAYEVGFRFGRFWGIQAGYHDYGTVDGFGTGCTACEDPDLTVPTSAETTGFSLSLVPELPLGQRLSLFGKVGLIAWETSIDSAVQGVPGRIDEFDEEDVIYGLGARLDFLGPLELFAEWESVGSDIETISFGVTLLF